MLLCFGHGCSGSHMHLEHERYHGSDTNALSTIKSYDENGMDALVSVFARKDERYFGLSMDGLISIRTQNDEHHYGFGHESSGHGTH